MDKKQKSMWQLAFLAFLIIATVLIIRHQQDMPYQQDSGMVFGTVYNITYQSDQNLKKRIEEELQKVDNALSPFNEHSIISHINRNEETTLNNMFMDVFQLAQQISQETNGAFDITVAPLVNAWGFGFEKGTAPTPHAIDSIMKTVGYEKVSLTAGHIQKKDPRIKLDCSAIAKGYGSDVVARLLRKEGIQNFMVEIGGEIVTSGISPKRAPWRIGVTKPNDDSLNVSQELQTVLNVTDKAMATSGNYRNFYYKNGRKYAHTINPKTGQPVQHNILSATVIAPSCAIADAYATSFMVMGLSGAKEILQKHPELMAYLIYNDEHGNYAVWYSPSMRDKIIGE